MAKKTIDAQIADLEEEIQKLKDKKAALEAKNAPQYPKHVKVKLGKGERGGLKDADGDGYYVVEVNSEEEEKAALKGKGTAVPSESVTTVAAKPENEDDKPANGRKSKGKK